MKRSRRSRRKPRKIDGAFAANFACSDLRDAAIVDLVARALRVVSLLGGLERAERIASAVADEKGASA